MGLIKKPSELSVKATFSSDLRTAGYRQDHFGVSHRSPSTTMVVFSAINGAHQVATLQPTSWEDTNAAQGDCPGDAGGSRPIVIDTVGKMLTYMSAYIINDAKMAMRDGSLSP